MIFGAFWAQILKALVSSGKPVPWSFVHSWRCVNCGRCCRRYVVELTADEWVQITRLYGFEVTIPSLGAHYLKKRADGSCIFLYRVGDRWLCGLQHLKPKSCKLWPFYLREKPVYGFPELAKYSYLGREFYVYADPYCRGLIWGQPSKELVKYLLPELVEIKLGRRDRQVFSTAPIARQIRWR